MEFTVSYHAPNGGYVHTPAQLADGKSNDDLRLEGANGVFRYGNCSQPGRSWNSTNYFVDVLYEVSDADPTSGLTPEQSPSVQSPSTAESEATESLQTTDTGPVATEPVATPTESSASQTAPSTGVTSQEPDTTVASVEPSTGSASEGPETVAPTP